MSFNIFQLLPQISAIKKRLSEIEKELRNEFGLPIKLQAIGADASFGIDAIVKLVSTVLSVPMNIMIGNDRHAYQKEARQIAMYLCKKYIPGIIDKDVGDYFSKDRTNVIHSCKRIQSLIDTNDDDTMVYLNACENAINIQIKIHQDGTES